MFERERKRKRVQRREQKNREVEREREIERENERERERDEWITMKGYEVVKPDFVPANHFSVRIFFLNFGTLLRASCSEG